MKVLHSNEKPASSSLFVLLGIFLICYVVGNFIGAALMILIGIDKFDLNSLSNLNNTLMSSKRGWWALIVGQGVGSTFMFLAPAVFYWLIHERKTLADLHFKKTRLTVILFIITLMIGLASLPIIGWLAKINEAMKFPESLKGLESIIKMMEKTAEEMTNFLVSFTSVPEYIAAMLVIAVVAGVGEEVLFRGVLQRKIWFGTGNIHVAIWLSAIIFSAIHFQFYGFIPRMLLGALFGYLYYWSGNLWVPIVGHIFNNGLSVTMMYAHNNKWTDLDMETSNDVSAPIAAAGMLLLGICIFLFKKHLEKEQTLG